MKRFLKRIGVFALAALCCAGVFAGSTTTAYATEDVYNFATHEVSTGTVYMDKQHGYDVNVSLYVLTQNTADYLSYKRPYKFDCYSHLPDGDDRRSFGYMTLSYDGEEIEELNGNMIYRYTWNMMDGDYAFSYPDGNGDFPTLTRTFEAPFIDPEFGTYYTMDDLLNGNYEVVTVESGDHVRIYAMLGEFRWCQQVAPEFIEWAKAFDGNYEIGDGSGVEPSETPSEETATEPGLSFGNTDEEPTMEENPVVEPKPEKEDVSVEIPPSDENTSPGFVVPLTVGIIAFIFIIILLVRRKKKDEE